MRCYFLRGGRIVGVEELNTTDEAEAVQQARKLFAARKSEKIEGFEVWDRIHFVHRFPSNGNGNKDGGGRSAAA